MSYSYKKQDSVWNVDLVINAVVLMMGLITLLPLVNVLARSLSAPNVLAQKAFMVWPEDVTVEAYKYIFKTPALLRAFTVSFSITVIGTVGSLLFTITCAYGLSKTQVPGNKFLMWYIIVAMLFHAGIIPSYYIVNNVLKLTDTYAVLIIPYLVSPFSIILMRNFFWSIPPELEESMMIDGASYATMLWRLIVPLSKAIIATIGLFYAVGHWNDFFRGIIYIRDNSKWPLPVLMRGIVLQQRYTNMEDFNTIELRQVINPDNIRCATIIFSIVPVLLVYPFIQKHFTKGIMIGAVKG